MLWVRGGWQSRGGRPFIVRSIVSIQETPACFQSMRIWMIGTQAEAWISSEHSWDCFPNFVTLIPLRVFTLSTEQVRSRSQAPQGTPLMNSNVQKISKLITFPASVSDLLKQTQTNKWSICAGGGLLGLVWSNVLNLTPWWRDSWKGGGGGCQKTIWSHYQVLWGSPSAASLHWLETGLCSDVLLLWPHNTHTSLSPQ